MYKRSQVFAAACIALFLFGITFLTLGSILPLVTAKFKTKGLNTGFLVSILPIGVMVGSLIFGPIVDRYGYKLPLIISILISAVTLQGLAFTQSISLLYACMFFIGFGGGIINGGTNALVADITTGNKGASLSLLGVSFGIGALGMPLLLGVLSKHFPYTTILSGVGFFMLLPVIYFLFTRFPVPKQVQGFPLKEGIKLLKEPALLLSGLFLFFQSGVESLSNNWTTTYLQDKLKVTNEAALYALSFSVLGLTVARLLLGSLLKKLSSLAVMFVSLLLILSGNLLLMNSQSYNLAFVAVIITGLGLAAGFPVILGYVGQLYANLSGTAFSIALVIALTGNTILNYLFGWITRQYSVSYLPVQMIACVICMLILLVLIKREIAGKVNI
ncbi:MAG TPA: MFS transporter [Chitinophagaceae bacterium]|nr:MFS transporter [Chitinophagaceae bacterium]